MRKIITVLVLVLVTVSTFAQTGINYKALIKDDSGNVLANTNIIVLFTIYEGDALTNEVYVEQHAYTTNANGFVILTIGEGNTVDDFNAINWGIDEHFINVQINIAGAGLEDMGTTQFMAVPYAKHAEIANNVTTKINQLSDAKSDDDGSQNGSSVFLGVDSGLTDDGTNNRNIGVGFETLKANTFGYNNVANGHSALKENTEGHSNVANGTNALSSNTTGNQNTANGTNTLLANLDGYYNTANGYEALRFNTTGVFNVANGAASLRSNTTGASNVANGVNALYLNTTGEGNTATGNNTLGYNITGSYNTACGNLALGGYYNTYGDYNVAIGYAALADFNFNFTGSNNIGIGYNAQVPSGTASNQVRIGNADITYAGIQVDWSITSDKRWKENVRELPYGLDMVMQLQPVDYTRKNNEKKTREMGFVAQDLEVLLTKMGYTDQGFLTKDDKGFLSVRYNDLIALLTKALQEQQTNIEAQNKTLEKLIQRIEALENKNN